MLYALVSLLPRKSFSRHGHRQVPFCPEDEWLPGIIRHSQGWSADGPAATGRLTNWSDIDISRRCPNQALKSWASPVDPDSEDNGVNSHGSHVRMAPLLSGLSGVCRRPVQRNVAVLRKVGIPPQVQLRLYRFTVVLCSGDRSRLLRKWDSVRSGVLSSLSPSLQTHRSGVIRITWGPEPHGGTLQP